MELILSKFIGNFLLNSNLNPGLFFFLILILVFVSRMLVRALCPRCPVWAARVFTLLSVTTALFFSSLMTTAECSPGNEPDQNAGASGSGNAGASESGTEALSSSTVEDKIKKFLSKYSKKYSPQQRLFDTTRGELQLVNANPSDLTKIVQIVELLEKQQFSSPREAASQLTLDYSKYFEEKYGKSLFL